MAMTQADAADVYARQLLKGLRLMARGDVSVRLPLDGTGLNGEIADAFNDCMDVFQRTVEELHRTSTLVGKDGRVAQRASVGNATGGWSCCIGSMNELIEDIVRPTKEAERILCAVTNGDLQQRMPEEIDGVPLRGEFLRLARIINSMLELLSSVALQVRRVTQEIREGRLSSQLEIDGLGAWADLSDSVNFLCNNIAEHVGNLVDVSSSIVAGELSKRIPENGRGEILELQQGVNKMIALLAAVAAEVTRVAHEAGVDGILGGRTNVPESRGSWKDLTDSVNLLTENLATEVRGIAEVATAVTTGDLTRSITVDARGDVAALKNNINEMILNLRRTIDKNREEDWVKTNLAKFAQMLQGQRDLPAVANLVLSELSPLIHAQHGLFFISETDTEFEPRLVGSYGYGSYGTIPKKMNLGLVGQCVSDKHSLLITDVPADYIKISSGLGEASAINIILQPVIFEGQVRAVIELASFKPFSKMHLRFFEQLTESISIVVNNIGATTRTEELLRQSQLLARELTQTNLRLEEQASTLLQSEALLQDQQEELREANAELQEKAALLSLQNTEMERKNREIDHARLSLEDKAGQLALTSRYKSEFLANMSHELRTPLNSLLILSKLLEENADGNLKEKQVEFAKTIHASGTDLLNLINEILDLSKIESGTITLDLCEIKISDLVESVDKGFRQLAETKGLNFTIETDNAGACLYTDAKRLYQVLRNLVSNSIKFTESGSVTVTISERRRGWAPDHPVLSHSDSVLAFAVQDSGIGIPADKHRLIFEAFHQADGTTSRRFGGTGLGLSISRELTHLLGGEITVSSTPGKGSLFTLFLPRNHVEQPNMRSSTGTVELLPQRILHEEKVDAVMARAAIADDRDEISPGDRVILLVEDDPGFARVLIEQTRSHNFKVLVAEDGQTAFALACKFNPDAMTLDIHLPDVNGWSLLDRLKQDSRTSHIPVQVISIDDRRVKGLKLGAVGYLQKPVTKEVLDRTIDDLKRFLERSKKRLLIVEPEKTERERLVKLIAGDDIETVAVCNAAEAMKALSGCQFDCVVLDLELPDTKGIELIRALATKLNLAHLPVVIFNKHQLSKSQASELSAVEDAVIVQDAISPERLLCVTATYLHRSESSMSEETCKLIAESRNKNPGLKGKLALIVDDDARNIFALASALERHEMGVLFAETGSEALELLKDQKVDIILMDVMMPEMDGYEAIGRIRSVPGCATVPVIALTANAMKGDRDRCLSAGASDYISKPVDTEQLMSLLRAWLID